MTAFGKAADFYKQASTGLPRDEEEMAIFLCAGLEACWFGNQKLSDVLFFVIWIQELIPGMKKIWKYSPTSEPRDLQLAEATRISLACVSGKLAGQLNDSSIVKPISMVSAKLCSLLSVLIACDWTETTRHMGSSKCHLRLI